MGRSGGKLTGKLWRGRSRRRGGLEPNLFTPCLQFPGPALIFPFPVPSMYAGDLIFSGSRALFPRRMASQRPALWVAPQRCSSQKNLLVLQHRMRSSRAIAKSSYSLNNVSVANYLQFPASARRKKRSHGSVVLNLTQPTTHFHPLLRFSHRMGSVRTKFNAGEARKPFAIHRKSVANLCVTIIAAVIPIGVDNNAAKLARLSVKTAGRARISSGSFTDSSEHAARAVKNRNIFLKLVKEFKLATWLDEDSKQIFSSIIKVNYRLLPHRLLLSFRLEFHGSQPRFSDLFKSLQDIFIPSLNRTRYPAHEGRL